VKTADTFSGSSDHNMFDGRGARRSTGNAYTARLAVRINARSLARRERVPGKWTKLIDIER
jgi:hypothetical protein